jgi:hypothetical protein
MMLIVRIAIESAHDDVGSGSPVVGVHGFPHDRAPQLVARVGESPHIALHVGGFGDSVRAARYTIDHDTDHYTDNDTDDDTDDGEARPVHARCTRPSEAARRISSPALGISAISNGPRRPTT